MTFAAKLFLLAGLAAVIPVVLHMINRQKAREAPFPTLRFLQISARKTRRRKRFHDLLLMFLRAAVLLLIALGLARPTLTNLRSLWGGADSAVVIVLDNSASMGMIDGERTRFETAVAAAEQILHELGDGDQVALLATGGPAFPELGHLDRRQDKIRQVLTQCQVSYERADLGSRLHEARQLLAKAEAPNKQIFVVTDMQKLSWDNLKESESATEGGSAADESAAENIPVVIVDCNRQPKPNVAVTGVDVDTPVPVAGMPVKVTAELLNTSPVDQSVRLELLVDGGREQTSPDLTVAANSRLKHEFTCTFRGGPHQGEVRLMGEDGSRFDNRRFFTLEIDQGISVAVVKPKPHEIPYLEDTYYVERALRPGQSGNGAIRMTPLSAEELAREPLDRYKVIFCVNLPAPGTETAERLRAFVAGGGSLVWIAGDNVVPENYNQMNQAAHGQLLPAPLVDVRSAGEGAGRDSWHVGFLDAKHPALSRLVDPPALYTSVLVYKQVRMDAEKAPNAWVLARLDDGEPLAIQRRVGRGRVVMFGTGVQGGASGWSNFPLRPIFMPLLVRLTFDLSGAEETRRQVHAGAPITLQFEDQTQPAKVEVQRPPGETVRLDTTAEKGKKGQFFHYSDTHEIGVYTFKLLDPNRPAQIAYSVNMDPDEANPAKLERDELESRLAPVAVVFADNPDDLSETFALLREGRGLWTLFLAAVLAGLVLETLLSNRLGAKQVAPLPDARIPATMSA
jgi:hypothetical protein